jgi:hypothetical protein
MFWFFQVGEDLACFQNAGAVLALKKGRFALGDEPKTFSRFALWTSLWQFAEVLNFPQTRFSRTIQNHRPIYPLCNLAFFQEIASLRDSSARFRIAR